MVSTLTIGKVAQNQLGEVVKSPTKQVTQPITIQASAALEPMTDEQLAQSADLIVLGRVLGSPHSHWNTPSGTLPLGTTVHNIPSDVFIFTDTPVHVEQFLKGSAQGAVVRVRTHGGRVPDGHMIVEDAAEVRGGQQVLLFLTRKYQVTGDIGADHYWVVGAIQGSYEIANGQATRRGRQVPLTDLLDVIARSQ